MPRRVLPPTVPEGEERETALTVHAAASADTSESVVLVEIPRPTIV
jgi:hypothetical protein